MTLRTFIFLLLIGPWFVVDATVAQEAPEDEKTWEPEEETAPRQQSPLQEAPSDDDWQIAPESQISPAMPNSIAQPASGFPNQSQQGANWQISGVMNELDLESQQQGALPQSERPWWTDHVLRPISGNTQPIRVNVGDLIMMAVAHSAKVSVARDLPLIRETAIADAASAFDWNQFVDARWNDTSEPVGSSLTLGGTGTRFREHDFSIDLGVRRKLLNGADFNIYQQAGHQNSNSTFFVPNNQATSRIVLGYTQPLLRGRGQIYNTSLVVLAEIDTENARDEFDRQLQSHLLEVARSYWALYLERADLAQKVSLYLKTKAIAEQLNSRSTLDAQRTQVISANAALESRKSELIRSRAAVKNAETRLRALLNAPALAGDAETMELIPDEHPTQVPYPVHLPSEFEIALQNRPEIAAAMKGIHAGTVRLQMAEHEVLPMLNLVTEAYVSGLRGESDFGNAWVDQFREGEPGYSVGIQYEIPLGRRAAFSNQRRRNIEIHQMQEQYRSTLELVRAEVEIAVRELQTAYRELRAKNRSRMAAEAEAETLETRWQQLGDQGGTGGLLLESLLRAQERVTQFEYEYAKAQMTYNLSLINLRHSNGTLYQAHQGSGPPVNVQHPVNAVGPAASQFEQPVPQHQNQVWPEDQMQPMGSNSNQSSGYYSNNAARNQNGQPTANGNPAFEQRPQARPNGNSEWKNGSERYPIERPASQRPIYSNVDPNLSAQYRPGARPAYYQNRGQQAVQAIQKRYSAPGQNGLQQLRNHPLYTGQSTGLTYRDLIGGYSDSPKKETKTRQAQVPRPEYPTTRYR